MQQGLVSVNGNQRVVQGLSQQPTRQFSYGGASKGHRQVSVKQATDSTSKSQTALQRVQEQRKLAEQDPTTIRGMKRYLRSLNWEEPWVEIITNVVKQRKMATTAIRMKEVVEFLAEEGVRNDVICNICCINPNILSKEVESELRPCVDYIKSQGVYDFQELLRNHARLLEYVPSNNGITLEKPGTITRAIVYGYELEGRQYFNVQYFRANARFLQSPISPWSLPEGAKGLLDNPQKQIGL